MNKQLNLLFVSGICLFAGTLLGGGAVFLTFCQSTISKESALGGPYNTARQLYFATVNFQREEGRERAIVDIASLVRDGFLDKKAAEEIQDKWRVMFPYKGEVAGNPDGVKGLPLIRMVRQMNQKSSWHEEILVTDLGAISVCYTFVPQG